MAFIQDATLPDTGATSSASITLSAFGTNLVVGQTVMGWVSWDFGTPSTLNSVSDGLGNVYTLNTRVDDGPNTQTVQSFFGKVLFGGAATIVGNLSVSSPARRGYAAVYSNVGVFKAQASQLQTTPGTTTDAVTSPAAAARFGDFLWGTTAATSPDSGTLTAGTGFKAHTVVVTALGTGEERFAENAGTYAATFTQSANSNRVTTVFVFTAIDTSPRIKYLSPLEQYDDGLWAELSGTAWF